MAILKSLILILSLILITMQERSAALENCPDTSHRKFRALLIQCPIERYHCLRNGSHCSGNGSTPDTVIEICETHEVRRKGIKTVFCGNLDAEKCTTERFSPEFTSTYESDKCPYLKSNCSEEGQVIISNKRTDTDNWCRCDYTRGYDYITPPKDRCKCKPREEDCNCYTKQCEGDENSLSPDYDCLPGNNRPNIIACPEIDMQINQEKESPKIMETVRENMEKDNEPVVSTVFICVVITILVILFLMIILCCRQVLKKVLCCRQVLKKDFSTRTIEIFHQLNDMIVFSPFEEVHQLAELRRIDNEEKIRIIILRGQTGAGKTHAAYWFCNEVKGKYSVIGSISAVDKTKFVDSLKILAKNLHLDLEHREDDMFEIVVSIANTIVNHLDNVLIDNNKCLYLILIDDVHVHDQDDTLSKMVLKTIYLLNKVNTVKLIITTTNSLLKDKFVQQSMTEEVSFEGMTDKECESFLQVSPQFKEETNESIHNLIRNIGRLPMTINSARQFMDACKMRINKFLEIYEKLDNAEHTAFSEIVKYQKIPLNYIKKSLNNTIWEVVTLFPYLDYDSVCQELIEACCHHICNNDAHAHTIIFKFLNFSLCQQFHRPRQRISKINEYQEDILISFHSETMLTLKSIDNCNKTNNKERQKLFSLLRMFCFEIDFDARVDTTLERNLKFLLHARNVLRLFERYEYDLCESEKVYTSFMNFIIGKTILYHGMDIPLAHKHLMKSRKLCLGLVKENSDLSSRKCPYLADQKGICTEEIPMMQKEIVTHGYRSLKTKTLDLEFVTEFVLNKRRNKRDTYVLQQESGESKMCKWNYLSKTEYLRLTTSNLAMPLELLRKTFVSELMLHILHDNGRALDELMLGAEPNEQVKRACAFEVDTYKELNRLQKIEKEFKNFPLLRHLAIERGEQDINVHQCTLKELESHIENLKKLLDKPYHYFEFGVVKTLSNNLEHHNLNCYGLLIKCIIEKYNCSGESEKRKILKEGRIYVVMLNEILSKIETDDNAVKWVEIPKFYNQCAHFLQLSGSLNDKNDLILAVKLYGKAIEIEENRQAFITRFLQEGYHGKVNCLLKLNNETDAKSLFDKLKNTLPKSSKFLIHMEALFSKTDN